MTDSEDDTPSNAILHDRFVRWQKITLQQLTYALNLILALSGAAIAFEISTSLSERFVVSCVGKFALLASLTLLVLSMFVGLCAVVSRLYDFRYTTRIARIRWKHPEQESKISRLEYMTDSLGKATWCLFLAQVLTFGLGIILALIVFFLFLAS
jgi:hypothetical protein